MGEDGEGFIKELRKARDKERGGQAVGEAIKECAATRARKGWGVGEGGLGGIRG